MKPSFEETYLREIILQVEFAGFSAQQVNQLLQERANPAFVFREMYAFLSHVAGVSRILWPPWIRDPEKSETARVRGLHLRTVLGIADDHPLRSRTLRDHLEHFDERLDRWSQETTHGGIVDLHIGSTSFIGGVAIARGDFLRVYEPERAVFTFRGDEFDIQRLATATQDLRTSVAARVAALRIATQEDVQPDADAAPKG